jgi:AraC-like DNA-binding protein
VEDVAEHINRSRSYLMRRFKAETGMQVNAYITDCKMSEACDLLMYSHTPLSEISVYLGFSSQSYFQNVFKKQFGMTPMQYRKSNCKIK